MFHFSKTSSKICECVAMSTLYAYDAEIQLEATFLQEVRPAIEFTETKILVVQRYNYRVD